MQFIDLAAQQSRIKAQLDRRIADVLAHGQYIMGPEVAELEAALSDFSGARHSLTCANGTDALQLALMALGIGAGQAVFCPAFTFAATAEVVPGTGAVPIFVDCDPETYNMSAASLERSIAHATSLGLTPAAVIAVDLFGLPADYDALTDITDAHQMHLIADSAQGFGSSYKGRKSGTIGTFTTTSFFPAKPLGCYGDGGALFCENDELADLIKSYRVHGKGDHKYDNARIGVNSRLDTLQAAILCEKLAIFEDEIARRQKVADRYSAALSNLLVTPHVPDGLQSSWAQYTVRRRDGGSREGLQAQLRDAGVPTVVYYPLPLHQQTAYRNFPGDPEGVTVSEAMAAEVFSLPMHPYLTAEDQDRVIEVLTGTLT